TWRTVMREDTTGQNWRWAGLIGLGAVLAAGALLTPSCSPPTDPWQGIGGPPRIVATFPPLACFAQNVGGDHVGVLTLCTAKGPHEFDPHPEDTRKLAL